MELSGNLSDFALSDILQILALSRKSGMVLVENGTVHGKIVLENGRIVFASSSDQRRITECLVNQAGVGVEKLRAIRDMALSQGEGWSFKDLIIESGLLKREVIDALVRDHVSGSIAKLVSIDKGRFGIALNEFNHKDGDEEIELTEGIEVNEVLLEAAKERDEAGRSDLATLPVVQDAQEESWSPAETIASDNVSNLFSQDRIREFNDLGETFNTTNTTELLCSFLTELRILSYESEVILTILRFCSEFAERGVLFSYTGGEMRGIGKYGTDGVGTGKCTEDDIRALKVPIYESTYLRELMGNEKPYIYCYENDIWLRHIRSVLGGKQAGLEAFYVPVFVNREVKYIVYGDNFPGSQPLKPMDSLIVFINQASLILEKLRLERELSLKR